MLVGITLKHRKTGIIVPYWKTPFFIEAENREEARQLVHMTLKNSYVTEQYNIEKITILDERSELVRHSDIRCLLANRRREHTSCVHIAHDKFFIAYHKVVIDKEDEDLKEAVYGLIKNLIRALLTGTSSNEHVLLQKTFMSVIEQETLVVDQNFNYIIASVVQQSVSDEEGDKIMDPNATESEKEIIIQKISDKLYSTILERMDHIRDEILLNPNDTIVDIYNIPIVPCDINLCRVPSVEDSDMNEIIEYIATHKDRIPVNDDTTGVKETVWLSDLPRYKYLHWIFSFILKKKIPMALHGRDIMTTPTERYCSLCGTVPIRECYVDKNQKYTHRCNSNVHSLCYLSEEDYNKIKEANKIEVE